LGGSLDPHVCFLLERGIKTLALRVRQQNKNAMALAEMLSNEPSVAKVYYPGLPSHPHHVRAKELFNGFGGVLSFEPKGGEAAAESFIERAKLAMKALSLGGVETLASRPALASHSGIPRKDRLALGISDALVRIAVGIEAEEDLIADFKQALC
jgi:cystathionine gamma-synthase/cystathionine gamma-lyase/cystathionine beta-lyase